MMSVQRGSKPCGPAGVQGLETAAASPPQHALARTAVSLVTFRTQRGSGGPGLAGGGPAGPDDAGPDDKGPEAPPTCGPSSHPTTTQPAADLA